MRGTHRALLQLLLTCACGVSVARAQDPGVNAVGWLYTMGNESDANAVIMYERGADGRLTPHGLAYSGGVGTDAGLGSQGALALSADGTRLFVVNAGSDDISTFEITSNSLRLMSTIDSGGDKPISLTVDDDVLYALNAGSDSISGFRTTMGGLASIADSERPLSGSNTDPAQISFSPDGRTLVITEKATDNIVLYGVDAGGQPESVPKIVPSVGAEPFGFGFNFRRQLIVSEAFDGAEGEAAVSSYLLRRNGSLQVVSSSVHDDQTAACWIVTTPNGLFAYTTNAGSGTISGYRVGLGGALTRFDDGGVTANLGADSAPIDMALSPDGRFLYVLASGIRSVVTLRVHRDGTLSMLETTSGLTPGATGLVVR